MSITKRIALLSEGLQLVAQADKPTPPEECVVFSESNNPTTDIYGNDVSGDISLRDLFAEMALMGFCADLNVTTDMTAIPRDCYRMADMMLKARNK